MSSSFVVCLEFGAVFSQILEMENELNQDWFRGVLRPYGALWTLGPKSRIFYVLFLGG